MNKHKAEHSDADSPEWTVEDSARAVPFEQLPASLKKTLSSRTRGPQKSPTKKAVSIRLSESVLEYYRSQGAGWQTRLDNDLKKLHHL